MSEAGTPNNAKLSTTHLVVLLSTTHLAHQHPEEDHMSSTEHQLMLSRECCMVVCIVLSNTWWKGCLAMVACSSLVQCTHSHSG